MFPVLFYALYSQVKTDVEVPVLWIIFGVVSTLLYPYSRFVYEEIMNFIFGGNIFFVNAIFSLTVKFITMYLCWGFAVFIAPIGLCYLYFYHTKNETNKQSQEDA